MDVYLFVVFYLAVGFLVSLYAYVRGVKARPTPIIFSVEDKAVVMLASALIGLVWILFAPVLVIRWIWLASKWVEQMWSQLLLRLPKMARRLT